MSTNYAMLELFLHILQVSGDAVDAALSRRHKKICPAFGKCKFDFFGPLIPY